MITETSNENFKYFTKLDISLFCGPTHFDVLNIYTEWYIFALKLRAVVIHGG